MVIGRALNQAQGVCEHETQCSCRGHSPMKLALLLLCVEMGEVDLPESDVSLCCMKSKM